MATLALNSGLWVRRLLNSFGEGCAYGGSPFQGRCPASEVNDRGCPEKPDHLRSDSISTDESMVDIDADAVLKAVVIDPGFLCPASI